MDPMPTFLCAVGGGKLLSIFFCARYPTPFSLIAPLIKDNEAFSGFAKNFHSSRGKPEKRDRDGVLKENSHP
jgi:hypothetical protein